MATRKRTAKRMKPARRKKAKPKHSGLDKNFEDFIEEISEHGRRIKENRCKAKDWWYGTFGAVGPLLGAVVGMVSVAIIAWVISLVNIFVNAPFLSLLVEFLFANLPLFLLIFLVVNYLKHIYISHERLYYIIKPVKVAFEIAVAFWLLAWVMQFAGMQLGSLQLMLAGMSITGSLSGIFLAFLVLGYIVALIIRGNELYGKKQS